MVKIEDRYFDKTMTSMMDKLYNAVCDDWDGLFYIGGKEGASKSTLAFQLAWYLDRDFNMSKVVFNGEDFINKCLNAKPGECIVFDEAYSVFNNRNYANKLTKKIVNMLTRIRSKQLFMIIVSPTFFDLNKYLIVHRARCLIRTYDNDFKRGFFAYYMYDTKNNLYYRGKRDHNIHAVKPDFRGRFTKWSPFDWAEYEKIKKESMVIDVNGDDEKTHQVDVDKYKREGNDEIVSFLRSKNLLKTGAMGEIAEGFYRINARSLSRRLMVTKSEEELSLH